MATLPDYTALGERPVQKTSDAVVGYRPQGSQIGTEIASAGQDIMQASAYVAEGNYRQDTIAAEAAMNVLNAKSAELQYHTDSGFMAVGKGGKAIGDDFRKQYMGKLSDAASEIGSSLQNDQQRALFKQRAQITALRFQSSLLQHQAQETKVFNTQVINDKIGLEMTSIARNPKNEIGFTTSMQNISSALDAAAEQEGWSAETKKQKQAAYYSAGYATRIEALMYGTPTVPADPDAAMEMYKAVAQNLDKATIEHLAPKLQQVGMAAQAQAKGAEISKKFDYTQTAAALDYIDTLPVGPMEKAAIRNDVEHRHAVIAKDISAADGAAQGKVHEMIVSGMTKASIMRTPEWGALRDKGAMLERMDAWSKRGIAAGESKEMFSNYNRLLGMASSDDKTAFLNEDLNQWFGKVEHSKLNELAKLQASVRNGENKADAADLNIGKAKKDVAEMLKNAGIDLSAKPGTTKATEADEFIGKFRSALEWEHQQTKRWPDAIGNAKIAAQLLLPVKERGTIYDSSVRAYKADPTKLYVPLPDMTQAEKSAAAKAYREKYGRTPSKADLEREYTRMVLGGRQ